MGKEKNNPAKSARESRESSKNLPFEIPIHQVNVVRPGSDDVIQECGGTGLRGINFARDFEGNGWPRYADCPNCGRQFIQTKSIKEVRPISVKLIILPVK